MFKSVRDTLDKLSRLDTKKAPSYLGQVAGDRHQSVNHSKKEWVRSDVHTNTLESFFSFFKRGLVGAYQHMDEQHVQRYLAEFDFRYNTRAKMGINDAERANLAPMGIQGKRLTYETTHRTQTAV